MLAEAVAAARRGPAEPLAVALLAVAESRDSALVRMAERLLVGTDSALWLALESSARRCCDWVPQVRDRARAAARRWLDQEPDAALLALGPVAFALERRRTGRWLAATLRACVRDGPDRVLAAGLGAPDRPIRRAAYQEAAGRVRPEQLMLGAPTDPDLLIRLACCDAVVRGARADGGDTSVRRLLASRTAAIRAQAVHTLALAEDLNPAKSALLDRAPAVRLSSQAVLRLAGIDPAEHYRAALHDQPLVDPAALAGIGETGTAHDRELVWPALAHPRGRGRAEAVRALRRLGAEPIERLAPLLTDPAPVVAPGRYESSAVSGR
jgi:hypothetical protein